MMFLRSLRQTLALAICPELTHSAPASVPDKVNTRWMSERERASEYFRRDIERARIANRRFLEGKKEGE